eukprot:NODE_658_length_4969_cov_1.543326.p2 type:complete len:377 gc:universal NODE_658_length_4969_cov_1.543326:1730-2860(+)
MLFATTVLAHCQTTYVGLNGDFRGMRDGPNGEDNSFYPLNHADLPFRIPGNWKYAVCRNTTTKSPDPLTVKPGDKLTLDFRPECNSGTKEGEEITVMSRGKKIKAQSGDFDGASRHKGGYCQVSMTYTQTPDGVNPQWSDFVVIAQYKGKCPDSKTEWDFNLPDQLPSGEAVMMWTWFSAHGRAEFYSTCWDVIVQGNSYDKGIYGFCVLYGNLNDTSKSFLPVAPGRISTSGSVEYKGKAGNPAVDATLVAIKTAPQMGCDDTFPYYTSLDRLPVTGPFGSGYKQGTPSLPAVPTETAPPTPQNHYNHNQTHTGNHNASPATESEEPAASSPTSAPNPHRGHAAPSPTEEPAPPSPHPHTSPSGGEGARRCKKKH